MFHIYFRLVNRRWLKDVENCTGPEISWPPVKLTITSMYKIYKVTISIEILGKSTRVWAVFWYVTDDLQIDIKCSMK